MIIFIFIGIYLCTMWGINYCSYFLETHFPQTYWLICHAPFDQFFKKSLKIKTPLRVVCSCS